VKSLKTIVFGTYAFGWLAAGFWLLGLPMDWSSWKTYAGLEVVALAMTFLTK